MELFTEWAAFVSLRPMPAKIRNTRPRARHFIKEWRTACGLSQQALADRIGATKQTISRVELHEQPYNQDTLELLAEAMETTPAALLTGPPGKQKPTEIETDQINPALLALTVAGLFQKIGDLGETEAELLAQAVVEVATMPSEQLAAGVDPVALAEGLASFARRAASPLKRQ